MPRQLLADEIAQTLLDRIVDGDPRPGERMPSENELSREFDVSRLTVREAIRTLQAQNVVDVARGRGTVVRPLEEWTGLEAVLRATVRGGDDLTASLQLIQVRRMIETGAAALAAEHHDADDLAAMETSLQGMTDAHERGDLTAFVEHDIRFHDVILSAAGNVFVAVLFEPLSRVMREKRRQTSAVPAIQEHAIDEHRKVLAAVRSGDPEAARLAMESHMTQTARDLRRHVFGLPD
ncbi:FadR/GntR family transcriptional regulator [Nocardiopsis sp. MG754419]|uniref:FadR/GntR family transcriptional regulator n=1 Tax=Nocardiopsis sp. MG754419 TaxID=2259865 RepID=UPI001BA972F4|nr:FadR/GntR family transcriptional regulator [Nocardiopsis sp. MG754419]MBR8740380.1 GntR family transcriptional regulator [Nocardiopsis sp. MG754419]